MQAYYSKPRSGRQWNAQRIGDIMRARRNGSSMALSVGELMGF